MVAQGGNGCVIAGQFRFCQGGMNFVMANLVEQNRWSALAALQQRDQVMEALRGIRRDRALAQGADRSFGHGMLVSIN